MSPLRSVYCKEFCFEIEKENHDVKVKEHALEINLEILPSGKENIFHHEKAGHYICKLGTTRGSFQDKELSPIIPEKAHSSVKDLAETDERNLRENGSSSDESLISSEDLRCKEKKNLGLVNARVWKWQGPPWYTNLSPVQIAAVEALPNALKADIEEKVHNRTLGVLLAMGVSPMPKLSELKKAMLSCVSTSTRAIAADRKLERKITKDSSLPTKDNRRWNLPDGNAKGNCSVKTPSGKETHLPTGVSKIHVEENIFEDRSVDTTPKTGSRKDAPRKMQGSGSPRTKNQRNIEKQMNTLLNSSHPTERPLEIQADAVAFLMSLYTALGGCKGRVWLSEEPQRDRLLLSSAAHLQLPTTLERLHFALPQRLRSDLRAFDNHESHLPDKVAMSLKMLQKLINEEKDPLHPSPYLAKPAFPVPQNPPTNKKVTVPRVRLGGDVDRSSVVRGERAQVIDEVKRALVEVARKFRDPIARLPFLWKHPDLKLWLDARRRAADPPFSAKRSKVTPNERKMLLRQSAYEWDLMESRPYTLHSPKLPKEVLRGELFSMNDFEAAREKWMKVRQEYIKRLRRTVIEESRDYWPTMCPPLPDPRPWKKKLQRPPLAPPPTNFSNVFYAYMPIREKDIIV